MVYRVLGLMSGSSLDGLDLALAEFQSVSGKWQFNLMAAACYPYPDHWERSLREAHLLNARDYQLLHTAYGHYLGSQVNRFIEAQQLQYQVQLIASHGHTVFHDPARKMTAQLGDGAALAAITGINTVSDLRAMDVALGGQGAPIVPIGDQLLWPDFNYLLNLGGIANLTLKVNDQPIAFDVCPANRVLNMLAQQTGKAYDENGALARQGRIDETLLEQLNALAYYQQPPPKSLDNGFGTEVVVPLIRQSGLSVADACRTYVAHIVMQVKRALRFHDSAQASASRFRLLVTGGGAHHVFLVELLKEQLSDAEIDVVIPEAVVIDYKEAIVMAFMGVLRWREEANVLASVTGATRNSIGGAWWMGNL